jgi:hypothetical protein
MFEWSAMTPQKDTLDSLYTLSEYVSYRLLTTKFQHSLSAVTLGIYLSIFTDTFKARGIKV